MSREVTNKLIEMTDEGVITHEDVMLACLNYMSEDDVAGMCHANKFFEREEDAG